LIIQTFHETLLEVKKFELTYESLWDICFPDELYPEEFQLTLTQSKPFFEKFNFKLVATESFTKTSSFKGF
jgi:hypothetical protein